MVESGSFVKKSAGMDSIYSVIVTYNGANWIVPCLNSIVESTLQSSVVIIDNNSSDDTLNLIFQSNVDCHVIQSDINLGFGKANNLGISYAMERGADFIFLINQDTLLGGMALETLYNSYCLDPSYSILSPMHYSNRAKVLDRQFSKYIGNLDSLNSHTINRVDFINAAFWFVPVDTFKILGLFDPLFDHYGEDNDFINRLTFHGMKLGLVPKFHAEENFSGF